MGEVRTQVKLTNAADLANSLSGIISKDQIRSIVYDALVDTGAVRSVIPKSVMDSL
jgi:hypothetical protein